jgi:outer membrane lipoprotein carrier protein
MLLALIAALAVTAPSTAPAPATPPARPALADPAGSPAQGLVLKVQAVYERTRDLETAFSQTYTYAGMGRRAISSGMLRVKKPGLMRWDYVTPTVKTIAVTGSRLVQFEPEENQVFVDEKFDATALSAAVTFLLGKGDLAREFEPSVGPAGQLVLAPRVPDPRVARITLTVSAEGEVTATAVLDGAGNENRLVFERLRRNVGLADEAFQVVLPKDVRRVTPPGR